MVAVVVVMVMVLVVVKVALTVVVEPTTSKTASSLKFKTLQEHLRIEIHEHK